jgi:light-regulated signal transduction histidine kinase (bacteriophytochrome)
MATAIEVTEQVFARKKIQDLVDLRTRELSQVNEALVKSNEELARSNANLEEFAHAASHDLKEPIRKIHYFTQQLKQQLGDAIEENGLRFFSRIENATGRMGNLIDDLLLYSHVSQKPLETENIDLNQKVLRVLDDLELDIEEKKATINVGTLPVINGYRRQLQQLFQNLIGNALKYGKKEVPPIINIQSRAVEENGRKYHLITFEDNGIGFEQEFAEKIFHMFTRLHGKAEYSGTGVGLAIVKKVVENHNGFIRAESVPGKGSTFFVYLPRVE